MPTTRNRDGIQVARLHRLIWMVPLALLCMLFVILLAKWLRELPAVAGFVMRYPGETALPQGSPAGFPTWLGWQHFLNAFFLVLIIRSGWLVRTNQRPSAYWTRSNDGLIRTKNPPKKITLDLWLHLSLDALWMLNGIVFIVLLFMTGQWVRILPTNWEVLPNALSAALQYASLDWPTENGWVNYNSLQVFAYSVTVFIAAPLAFITGIRMSGAWPANMLRLNRLYPIELARAVHFPVMIYFTLFLTAHITLVLATGALRNLNHMYGMRDEHSWVGFWYFAGSLVVTVIAWIVCRPIALRPIASITGKVTR